MQDPGTAADGAGRSSYTDGAVPMFFRVFLTSFAAKPDVVIRRRNGETEAGSVLKTRPGLHV